MGLNVRCPYTEEDPTCGKCMTCHAINPPARAPNRRVCQRTRQWPGCPRYVEAWRIGVTPYREDYAVTQEEQTPTIKTGIPMETSLTPEPPCSSLVYKESSCATCGGYVCSVSQDRRIMDTMLEVCMKDPNECVIHNNRNDQNV